MNDNFSFCLNKILKVIEGIKTESMSKRDLVRIQVWMWDAFDFICFKYGKQKNDYINLIKNELNKKFNIDNKKEEILN